jgi:hypothetical protein
VLVGQYGLDSLNRDYITLFVVVSSHMQMIDGTWVFLIF